MTVLKTSVILIYCFTLLNVCKGQGELKSVVIIYRHGDRTPIHLYPLDPYNTSYWPEGLGQLTNLGKLEQYHLGKWLRNRYNSLLPQEYSREDIYVTSTDLDRTLMSAEANLAGLYPPDNNQTWNPSIKWQPIPIHTTPELEDPVLAMKKSCPSYLEEMSLLLKTPFFRHIDRQLQELYSYLTRHTGEPVTDLVQICHLYSEFFIEENNNLTLPDWAQKVYPEKMKPWSELSFAVGCYNQKLARLRTGPLFNEIVEHFLNVTRNNSSYKAKVYSAHDTTIADVLMSLNAFEYHLPPYCSTILIELYQLEDKYYVNLLYKNSTEPQNITLSNCDFNCDLFNFIELLKPITVSVSEWEKECTSGFFYFLESHGLIVPLIIGLWLTLILIFIGMYYVSKYFSNKEYDSSYIQLPNEEIS